MNQNYHCERVEAPLYRIGVFAQMNRMSIKTLRHYDEMDLLKPAYVDESNGYRYYTSAQLPILHRILALREIGFSLEEIRAVLAGASEQKLLQNKRQELFREISNLTNQIACIESYLLQDQETSVHPVIIKSLPEVTIAYRKLHLKGYEELFYAMPDMGAKMEGAGCVCSEPDNCFTLYQQEGYQATDIDVLICEGVTTLQQDRDGLCFMTLDAIPQAACILHKGPYEKLPESYQAIIKYLEENQYEIDGCVREAYIDGVWNQDSSDTWLTEIQIPVKRRT